MKNNFARIFLIFMCTAMLTGCGGKTDHIEGEVMNSGVSSVMIAQEDANGNINMFGFTVDSSTKLSGVKHVYDLKSGQIIDVGFINKNGVKLAKTIRVKK